MPDWILHIAAARLAARPRRVWDPRWLFLGAVLPDALPRCFSMAMHYAPPLRELSSVWLGLYVAFLHTPVSVALLVVALVAIAADRRAALCGLLVGAATHFLLDLLQCSWGGGTSLLYPVDLTPFSWQVGWYDSGPTYAALGLATVYLVLLAVRGGWPVDRALAFSPPRLAAAGIAAVACLVLPLATLQRAADMDLGNAQLGLAPERLVGRALAIAVTPVLRAEDGGFVIDRADREFLVQAGEVGVEAGDFVSLRGTFDGEVITASEVFVHRYGVKVVASLLGAVFLILVWWPGLRSQWRARVGREVR